MRRLFWLGIGVAVGVLVVRKLSKVANSYTPQAMTKAAQSSAQRMKDSARSFIEDVRAGAQEHEEDVVAAVLAEQEAVRERNAHAT